MGPLEQAVRATLPNRPASLVNGDDRRIASCFAGLFNGALSRGHVTKNDGLFIGKAECEWDWREVWGKLRDLGLVEWRLKEEPNHPDHGGTTTWFYWTLMEKGREVRDDDNLYFKELLDAMRKDDAALGHEQSARQENKYD